MKQRQEHILREMQGELRELRGETREFKRQVLTRLEAIEHYQRGLPRAALSAAAACVSMLGALAACAAHFLGEGII